MNLKDMFPYYEQAELSASDAFVQSIRQYRPDLVEKAETEILQDIEVGADEYPYITVMVAKKIRSYFLKEYENNLMDWSKLLV